MSDPTVVDPVGPRAAELLGCLIDLLDHYGAGVCRAFVHPGTTAPWDACGSTTDGAEGQAWVAVPRIYPVAPFPTEDAGAQRCHPVEYAANITAGVLRCAATVDDEGRAPAPADVSTDAAKVTRDAAIILEALLCCYLDDDADPGTFRLGDWTPLGPDGGCVGGQWTATIRIPACPCPDLSGLGE